MIRRATFLFLLIAGVLTVLLYSVENQVESFQQNIESLNQQIVDDRKAIHVLKAEWSHLNDPQRLKVLAERHLKLKPVALEQISSLDAVQGKNDEPAVEAQPGVNVVSLKGGGSPND